MNPVLLSIVVPVYNIHDELNELGNELTAFLLNHNDLDVFLIDDGSTDGSGDLADKFASESDKIQVIHQANSGLSAARNTGMMKSSGEYVWFLDGDDLFNPITLEKALSNLKLETADIFWYSHQTFRNSEALKNGMQSSTNPALILDQTEVSGVDMLRYLGNSQVESYAWSYIARTSLYKDNAITFPVSRSYEDIATTYKLFFLAHKIKIHNESLVYYRQRGGSIVTRVGFNNIEDVLVVNKELKVVLDGDKLISIKNLLLFKNTKLAKEFLLFNKANLRKENPKRFIRLTKEIRRELSEIDSTKFSFNNKAKLLLTKFSAFFVVKKMIRTILQ